MNINAAFFQNQFQILRNLLIHIRKNSWECLKNRHLTAKFCVNRCEFHTDNSATDNCKALRHTLHTEQFITGQDSRKIHSRNRQDQRLRSCCQNDMLCFQHLFPAFRHNFYFLIRKKGSFSGDLVNFVALKQPFHTGNKLLCCLFFVFKYFFKIKCYIFCMDTKALTLFCASIYFCCMNHCFCRNTSTVQTCSACFSCLNNSRFKSKLCCLNSSHISSRSGTDHDYIIFLAHTDVLL